jgi:hypothetical protein
MWDLGSGCIWDRGGGSPSALITNNTCYDYGKGSGAGGPNPEGIAGYSDGGRATIRNNLVYAPNGTSPFDASPFASSNNMCASGKSCGSSSQTWSSQAVLSTDPNSANFMRPGTSSGALNAGMSTAVATSYAGVSRPVDGVFDIGAFEGTATAPIAPSSPTNLAAQ